MPHWKRRRPFTPRVDSLGSRVLPSASPTVEIVGDVLLVSGTEGPDAVEVTIRSVRSPRGELPLVRVSGIPRWFVARQFASVVVDAKGGDDLVAVDDRGRAVLPMGLVGGDGDDTILGGSGADVLIGGPGSDAIFGRGGLDLIDGGPGTDLIDGVPEPAPLEDSSGPVPAPEPEPASSSPFAEPTPLASPPVPDDFGLQVMIDRTNQARVDAGLAPLEVDPRLQEAARIQAENMARLGRLSHDQTETGTPTLEDRARAVGYAFSAIGENIGFNYDSPALAVDGWLASDGHRRNLLDDSYEQLGVAIATDAVGRPYYVQVFGRPE
ncbi:CAP domain-containing protein [Tautonia sociabilis]|uniref:SCP domain-containing protein n=1 Tax=Tautonia sociabilis TaxID=2080755 RepID=A0A432MQS6_9BACT|nr:CAP domain-containing protein [Tautonia sociabilis]RUL89720.1 hypothetical protein TsocGM_00715 [Tautonia sociabilis]